MTQETLREANKVAALTDFQLRVVALPIHEKPMAVAFEAGWDAAIATMLERLQNLPNEMADSIAKKHFVSFEVAKLIGRDLATAFQQENSDG